MKCKVPHQRGPEIDLGNQLSTASSAGCSAWKSPVTPWHPHLTKQVRVCAAQHMNPTKSLEMTELQEKDPFCKQIREYLQEQKLPRNKKEAEKIITTGHAYEMIQGILCRTDIPIREGETPLVVLSQTLIHETMKQYHDSPMGGHRKFRKLLETLKEKYWFPRISQYISDYCRTCHTCQISQRRKPVQPPQGTGASKHGYPNICVHMDATKALGGNRRGFTHIIAFVFFFFFLRQTLFN